MKLTKKREQWAQNRKNAKLVGKPLVYPASVSQQYERQLDALIKRMRKEYERDIAKLYKRFDALTLDASLASQARIVLNELGRRWEQIFNRASKDIADGFISRLDKFAKRDAERSLEQLSGGLTINVPQWPGDLQDKIKAAVNSNVALIRNIPEEYRLRIEGIVNRSIESGQNGSQAVFNELMRGGEITEKRAKLIATDQTRKVTSAMATERMKAAGVERWRWVHSGGGKEPRELHLQLNGQEFRYDEEPPVIDERTGERGYPGQLINCRCVQVPVIDFSADAD